MTRKAAALALAVLLVASAIPMTGLVGTASASTYTHEFNNSEKYAVVDVGNYSGTYTLQVEAHSPTPSGSTTTVFKKQYNASNTDNRWLYFGNFGAYDNLTVKVVGSGSNSGSPEFMTGADAPVTYEHKVVASTGGDSGFSCDMQEEIAAFTMPDTKQIDCNPLPGATDVDTTETDAQQLHLDFYESGAQQEASNDIHLANVENQLQDAKTVARIKGKNAYIKALNNGSSETAALSAAKLAVQEYYSRLQANLVAEWDASRANQYYLLDAAKNESGISVDVVDNITVYHNSNIRNATLRRNGNTDVGTVSHDDSVYTVPLENGSEVRHQPLYVDFEYYSSTSWYWHGGYWNLTEANEAKYSGRKSPEIGSSWVSGPSGSDPPAYSGQWRRMSNAYDNMSQQNDEVEAEMETLVNNTYSDYQQGDINNSDLADPYVLASEFSPGSEYQGWAAAQLTLMGTNSPDAFDQIGKFNLTYEDNTTETGVLFSQENPASGSFEVNTTYDPSQVNGTQYIVTADATHEITQNFTIDSIRTHDGQTRQNVTIVEKTYTTTNTTELKQLYEELAFLRQQIETREQNLKTSGGGGGAFFEGNSSMLIAGAVVVAGVALLVGRKEGGNNY